MVREQTDGRSSGRRRAGSVKRHEEALKRAESTRQRILEAAASQFLRYGYDGTSMARVAKEVGVSASALYWHFDSKVDLAYAFLESSLEAVRAYVDSEVTAEEPGERLAQFVRAYVTYELQRGASLPAQDTLQRHGKQILMESLPDDDKLHLRRTLRRPYEMLSEILEAGATAGVFHFEDRAITAQFILTAVDYVFTWYRPDGRFDVSTIADLHVAMALRAVGAPVAGSVR
jgi:AcrR family transcriptional regulator